MASETLCPTLPDFGIDEPATFATKEWDCHVERAKAHEGRNAEIPPATTCAWKRGNDTWILLPVSLSLQSNYDAYKYIVIGSDQSDGT